ncbi:MAG TPA: DUF1003 domain-containing protein [Saprospiraceae bacterium]|nr:DUF1003 domain-containing protein [Saprospiraceae bacterium]
MKQFKSDISQKLYPIREQVSGGSIRPAILDKIKESHPTFNEASMIALQELNQFREKYISDYLSQELKAISNLEQTVLEKFKERTTISDKLEEDTSDTPSFGQRMADHVATFGGSWTFIIYFGLFLVLWISINVFVFYNKGFDPYPFILLNLILSCIAAIQAPVIMMSQNRQEEKDRDRSKKDYMINLKAELEIKALHEKIDHLIIYQQEQLLEIQKVQIEMMNDILQSVNKK